ncbi:MAG: DUF362 domain-containing protein [Deferribacteres bacterium]|nr:DUF362 domain-containing protein [candidate division KSB1 bacterium]MCB9501299.1 DUF362 domain-containing protein [Deferribacteres bacterium]
MPDNQKNITRRDFIVTGARLGGLSVATAGMGFWLKNRSAKPEESIAVSMKDRIVIPSDPNLPEMVIAKGGDPRAMVKRALLELGGINRFIASGDIVVIKPNMAWDRTPEQAANTNPGAVAAVVELCKQAGASQVIVTDVSCHEPRRCYQRSGIAEAASAAGAKIIFPEKHKFHELAINGQVLTEWPLFEPFLYADKVINMPIAKHHNLTGVTLGMKNWFGVLGGKRNQLHQKINESITDLAELMKPTLTILDGFRVLQRNGPTGGNVVDVRLNNTIIASTDPVAVDSYAASAFFGLSPMQVKFVNLAHERKLGNMYFDEVRSKHIEV